MTWAAVLALAAGTYAMKAAGPLALHGRRLPPRVRRVMDLLPAALFAALVGIQTLAEGTRIVVDARLVGVLAAVAVVGLSRRRAYAAAMVVACVVTAGLRLVGAP